MKAGNNSRVWQRMLSGRRLDLIEPSPLDVEIEDIAHGLARVARWNGQTTGDHAFSVAQHSVIVLQIFRKQQPNASAREALTALIHDGPEYVIGDMISPFKTVLGDDYKAVEARLQEAIHVRYELEPVTSERLKTQIKRADTISAYFEATELAGFSLEEATKFFGRPRGFTPEMFDLIPWPAGKAQEQFLTVFYEIEKTRHPND
ncbi:MAG: HD family hydrolase [Pseudomonadota bacterium]